MSSTLDQKLQSILQESREEPAPIVKEASSPEYSNDISASLVKIANLVRNNRVEPTYKDLYNFLGGLHGN